MRLSLFSSKESPDTKCLPAAMFFCGKCALHIPPVGYRNTENMQYELAEKGI